MHFAHAIQCIPVQTTISAETGVFSSRDIDERGNMTRHTYSKGNTKTRDNAFPETQARELNGYSFSS